MRRHVSPALAAAFAVAMISAAPAQTYVWTGSQDQNWNNAANWAPQTIANGTTVAAVLDDLGKVGTVNLQSSVTLQSLSFNNLTGAYNLKQLNGSFISGLTAVNVGTASGANTIGVPLSWNGANPLTITNGSSSSNPTLVIAGAMSVVGTGGLTVTGSGCTQITGSIGSGSSNITGLTKTGSGRLELRAGNSMVGDAYGYAVSLKGGTLAITDDSALGASGPGNTLLLAVNSTTTGGLEFLNGGVNVSHPVWITDPTRIVCNGSDSNTISSAIGSLGIYDGAIVKDGTGSLYLSNTGNKQSRTVVNAGTLIVTADGQMGVADMTLNGGALHLASSFSSARSLNLNAATNTVQVDANLTVAWTGAINGTGNLTKTGPGTLDLSSGAAYFTGGATVVDGTLKLSTLSGGPLVLGGGTTSGAVVLTGGGAVTSLTTAGTGAANSITCPAGGSAPLTVNNATNQTYAGTLMGPISLTKTGAGTLTLTNTGNTYSGGTFINGGTVAVPADAALGAADLNLDGGTFEATASFTTTRALGLGAGGGTILVDPGVTLTLQPIAFSGNGGLTKSGAGILAITGGTGYGGGTFLNGGILSTSSDTGLGTATGGLTFGGGTLHWTASQNSARAVTMSGAGTIIVDSGATVKMSGQFSGAGTLTKMGLGTLTLSADNSGYSGGVTISSGALQLGNANALAGSTVNVTNTNGLTFGTLTAATIGGLNGSGNIALGATNVTVGGNNAITGYTGMLSGTGSLTKVGTGSLNFSGDDSGYSGAVTINAGVIKLGNTNALAGSTVTINVANGMDTGVSNATLGGLAGAGTITHISNLTVGGNNTDTIYSGVLGGPGSMTKTGTGTLTLAADNSGFAGPWTIGGGTVKLGNANALAGSTVTDNATLDAGGLTAATLAGLAGSGAVNLGATNLTVGGNNGNTTYSGTFAGTGSLTKIGNGTLTLSGDNSGYSGGVTIGAGVIKLANANALAGSTVTASVNNGLSPGTLAAATIGGLAGSGNVGLGATALTVGGDNADTTFGGVLSGTGSLTKTGSGTLILSNAGNTYSGGTTINGGTLRVGTATSLPAGPVALGNVAGAALDLNGFTYTINALSGGGPLGGNVLTGGGSLTIGTDNSSTAFGGAITGGGTLTKSGAGTLTLTGTGTSIGVFNITGGGATIATGGMTLTDGNSPFAVSGTAATTLTVSGGAVVNSTSATAQPYIDGPTGTAATVTGAGSQLNSGLNIYVGLYATGSMTVQNGGSSTLNNDLLMGYSNGSTGNLLVQSGGAVTAKNRVFLGGYYYVSGSTGSATVDGAGSTLSATNGIFVGSNGTGSLTLQNGGQATAGILYVGDSAGATGSVTLSGTGSKLSTTYGVVVGNLGSGTLTVQNGGALVSLAALDLCDGGSGSGSILIQSGGTASASRSYVGYAAGAIGGTIVTGAGSQLTLSGTQAVGIYGTGSLMIQAGGVVTAQDGLIGGQLGSTGAVTVTGTGSTWTMPDQLQFGQTYTAGTASLTVKNGGAVSVGGTTYFQSGVNATFTVDGGTYSTSGLVVANATAPTISLSDPATGSALTIGTGNASSNFGGPIVDAAGGPGTVTKVGTGTLILTGHLTNTGGYTASQGTIDFNGALVQPGTGTLAAAAGATVQYDNAARVFGGFLAGPGTHVVNGASFTGTTSYGSAAIGVAGPATFTNFANGGPMTVAAGLTSPPALTRFTNEGSGSITLGAGGKLNVADFQTYGVVTLNPGASVSQATRLTNAGSSPLYFNGGSRTFIGTPQTAGQNLALVDLHGQNAVVAGGLFVNNGFVGDSTASGATIVADFGSLVKGAGVFANPVITQNGGKFQAGNSPGQASFGSFNFGPGGVDNYLFAIDDATGAAGPKPDALGHVSGWSLVKSVDTAGGIATSGDFTWTATPAAKLTLSLETLVNPTTVGIDIPGPMDHFDPAKFYSWPAVEWTGIYNGPADAAALVAATTFDTSRFNNRSEGLFGWDLDTTGHTLSLTYTPVPEPGSLALAGLAAIGWVRYWRRRWTTQQATVKNRQI